MTVLYVTAIKKGFRCCGWPTVGRQPSSFCHLTLSCGWFQWDGLNANESAALPKIIFSSPPSSVSYCPDKSQQTQSMDRCVLHLTLNELIITGFSRCAVIMLCLPNVAITHCWLKLIEDYVFPRQCVHVLFQNELLLHIHRGTVFVWVLEFGSLYLTVAELKISRADTDPTDKIHRLILKEFKNTFPCLLKKFFY